VSASRRLRPRSAAVVQLPTARPASLLPTARSVVIGVTLAATGALGYVAARESPLFAVRTIVVSGAPPPVAAQVREALSPVAGRSLVGLGSGDVVRLATAVPDVQSVSYDRAFPNTLRVTVKLERPLAVLREGPRSWLVARSGRIVRPLSRAALPALPRIWEPATVPVSVGTPLAAGGGADAVAALAPLRGAGLIGRVASVRRIDGDVTYVLRGGAEIRAGRPDDLLLKLTVARRILDATPSLAYVDVSVVERPVGAAKAQLSG
jgi:cell division protein FtsQ